MWFHNESPTVLIVIVRIYLAVSIILNNSFSWSLDQNNLEDAISSNDFPSTISKIIGGSDVTVANKYPWFALFLHKIDNGAGGFRFDGCGATLVTKEFLITAAHCVIRPKDVPDPTYVGIGILTFDAGNRGQKFEIVPIEETFVHPLYTKDDFKHDIALIKIARPSSITPLNMDSMGTSEEYSTGKKLTVLGFGCDDFYNQKVQQHLKEVELEYVRNEDCIRSPYLHKSKLISKDMMCAVEDKKSFCYGDSGGPLYDAENDIVVGITSWGTKPFNNYKYPSVFSRISDKYSSWVKPTICLNSANAKPSFCNDSSTSSEIARIVKKQLPFGIEQTCNECGLKVALQCRYKNTQGNLENCLDLLDFDIAKPFTQTTREQCKDIGTVPAEFRFKMCNYNKNEYIFKPSAKHNLAQLRGKRLNPGWWNRPLPSGECRSLIIKDSIDFCQMKRRLEMAMQGDLILSGKKRDFCRCYLSWTSTIEYVEPKHVNTPTQSPEVRRPLCDTNDAIISKIVIPSNNSAARYVQLYFGLFCQGLIDRNFTLALWKDGKKDRSALEVNISRFAIPPNGYVNICSSEKPAGIQCNKVVSFHATSALQKFMPGDKIALIDSAGDLVLDIFSIPRKPPNMNDDIGAKCVTTCEYFK